MIPVYVCEDNKVFQELVSKTIEKYITIQGYDMQLILVTAHPEEIIKKIETQSRGIYFLDVDLKGEKMNGFDLGKAIRKVDARGFIIYVTDHAELAFETFKLRLEAMDYIVKGEPDTIKKRIRECLDSIFDRIMSEKKDVSPYYSITVMNETYHLPIDEILYFETSTQKHRVIVNTISRQIEYFEKLSTVETQLANEFIRTHRSFLVNKNHIDSVDYSNNIVHLKNGQQCLLARNAKKMMKKRMENTL